MNNAAPLFLACLLATACDSDPALDAEGDVCAQAADVLESCGIEAPDTPAEGCVGDYAQAAAELVDGGCDTAQGTDGKADGFWCQSATRWTGLCNEVPLSEVAAIATVDDVCGVDDGPLCAALRQGDAVAARDAVTARIASEDREAVLSDPAVRLYLRERALSLFALRVVDRDTLPGNYATEVDAVLSEHYPAYDPAQFAMAHHRVEPSVPTCTEPSDAIVFFPGVVRFLDRAEFSEQRDAIEDALPCVRTYLVDTGSFVHPETNATRALATVDEVDAELGAVPLHLVGYSQGSTNALQTLVQYPEIADRTDSLMVMNAAAHGSEVADTLGAILDPDGCETVPAIARPTCEWAAAHSPVPTDFLLETLAAAMGVPVDELHAFIAAEDDVAPAPDLRSFLEQHLPGVRSLTTEYTRRFWASDAQQLPKTVLYYSFRAAISNELENLPLSNKLFHALLERAGDTIPYNDMQVRLENQALGGPVAEVEVVGPVAEGNHWQWQLASGIVPEHVMPGRMTDRIPHREILVAYFETLAEVGLIGPRG